MSNDSESSTSPVSVPKVLIVDDEDLVRNLLEKHLSFLGYQTRSASNGVECLKEVDEWRPNAILLDIKMPKLDGFGVADALRERHSDIPILIISALPQPGNEMETNGMLVGEFIPKPFQLDEVRLLLETALLESADSNNTKIVIPTPESLLKDA